MNFSVADVVFFRADRMHGAAHALTFLQLDELFLDDGRRFVTITTLVIDVVVSKENEILSFIYLLIFCYRIVPLSLGCGNFLTY